MNYLSEAFEKLNTLNEDTFEVTDDGVKDLSEFDTDALEDNTIKVIDDEADDIADIEDSYIGKVIIDCCVCHSKIYKDPEEIKLDDDDDVVNKDEECPYCFSSDGFKIIGEVRPFEEEPDVKVEITDKEDIDEEEKSDDKKEEDKEKREALINRLRKIQKQKALSEGVVNNNTLTEKTSRQLYMKADSVRNNPEKAKKLINKANKNQAIIDSADADAEKERLVAQREFEIAKQNYNSSEERIANRRNQKVNDAQRNIDDANAIKNRLLKRESLGRGRNLIETPVYGLEPRFDARKSFYGKAQVEIGVEPGVETLYSYGTPVCEIRNGKPHLLPDWDSSQTTLRHVKDFLRQNGFPVGPKAKLATMYESLRRPSRKATNESIRRKAINKALKESKNRRLAEEEENVEDNKPLDRLDRIANAQMESMRKNKKESFLKSHRKAIKEGIGSIELDTDTQHISISAEDKADDEFDTELGTEIAPVSDETVDEIENNELNSDDIDDELDVEEDTEGSEDEESSEDDFLADENEEEEPSFEESFKLRKSKRINESVNVNIRQFNERAFNKLITSHLKESYSNVINFKTTDVVCDNKNNKMIIEGKIKFNTKHVRPTRFVFEAKDIDKSGRVRFIGENMNFGGKGAFTVVGTVKKDSFITESVKGKKKEI